MEKQIKVYLDTKISSRGILRVVKALKNGVPPTIKIIKKIEEADLIIFHVNGRQDRYIRQTEYAKQLNKKYIIIQYCLKSTMRPSVLGWLPIWKEALLVWSYYDLKRLCREEGCDDKFNFYYSPLGSDKNIFKPLNLKKKYIICTSGLSYLSESVREVILATEQIGGRVAHLGPKLDNRESVDYFTNISDRALVELYNQCYFVSGLRRKEGFELPALEGLLCGTRPILFNLPCYQWYRPWGIFIPETDRPNVIKNVIKILRKGTKLLSKEEILKVNQKFNCDIIIKDFWNKTWKHYNTSKTNII